MRKLPADARLLRDDAPAQAPATDTRAMRRYLLGLAGGLVLVVGAIAAMNAMVDPYGVYRGFGESRNMCPEAGTGFRVAMAERVRQSRFDTALIGTSRVSQGVSDQSPWLAGRSTVNLGFPGSNFDETSPILRYTIAEGRVRRVLLFVDFFQFTSVDINGHWHFDFAESRFNPNLTLVEYHSDKLVGWNVTKRSTIILKRDWRLTDDPPSPAVVECNPRQDFERNIRRFLECPYFYGQYRYSPEKVEMFRDAVRFAHAHGVELHVAISPVHAVQLETLRAAGLWETFENWKRDLARIVSEENKLAGRTAPLWDFTGYTSFPAELSPGPDCRTPFRYYSESSHFTTVLGDEMLARMLSPGAGDPEFGVLLTAENVEERLARIRQDRGRWVMRNVTDVEWVERIALDCGHSPPAVRVAREYATTSSH